MLAVSVCACRPSEHLARRAANGALHRMVRGFQHSAEKVRAPLVRRLVSLQLPPATPDAAFAIRRFTHTAATHGVSRGRLSTSLAIRDALPRNVPLACAIRQNGDRFRRYWQQSLVTYAYPVIGHLPVATIDRGLVKQVLAPIWNTKTKSAKDLRGRISKILGWAIAEGWREPPNPAAWGENLEHSFPRPGTIAPPKPFAARSYKAFMARLRKDDRIAARALEFLILCASRTGEVRFAKWSEINWDERTWTIPKARMKMRRNAWVEDHTVPLSDPALGILMALKGDGTASGASQIAAIDSIVVIVVICLIQDGFMRLLLCLNSPPYPTTPLPTVGSALRR